MQLYVPLNVMKLKYLIQMLEIMFSIEKFRNTITFFYLQDDTEDFECNIALNYTAHYFFVLILLKITNLYDIL